MSDRAEFERQLRDAATLAERQRCIRIVADQSIHEDQSLMNENSPVLEITLSLRKNIVAAIRSGKAHQDPYTVWTCQECLYQRSYSRTVMIRGQNPMDLRAIGWQVATHRPDPNRGEEWLITCPEHA